MKLFGSSRKEVMELEARVRELEEKNQKLYEEVRGLRIYRHEMEDATFNTQLKIYGIFHDESKDELTREIDISLAMSSLHLKSIGLPDNEILDTKEKIDAFFTDGKEIEF